MICWALIGSRYTLLVCIQLHSSQVNKCLIIPTMMHPGARTLTVIEWISYSTLIYDHYVLLVRGTMRQSKGFG